MQNPSSKLKNKVKRGMGKVEVLVLKDEIFQYLKEGYPLNAIFEFYLEERKISIKRSTFYKHVKKLISSPDGEKTMTLTTEKTTSPETPPGPKTGSPADAKSKDTYVSFAEHKKNNPIDDLW